MTGAWCTRGGLAQTSTQAPGVIGQSPADRLPGIAAGETGALSFNAASVTTKNLGKVMLTFSDVAGQHYSTESIWHRQRGTFDHLRLEEREGLRIELIPGRASSRVSADA